ncbi:MAG TPA: YceI family protein [Gemmatimonadaceae bacterium]|jgi:polyisoprenoid-binding protein YceI
MKWNLDTAHSAAEFAVKHLMISTVKGRFNSFTGTGETDADGTIKSAELSIDAASLNTNVDARDNHLRSADFFEVEKYPKITFKSTKIDHKGTDITITGDLTIRGVSKPVTLKGEFTPPMSDPWGNSRSALAVSTKINRKDWGLQWNQALEAGGWAVGDEVKINVEFEAVAEKAKSSAAA